jgi:hypothetical protein
MCWVVWFVPRGWCERSAKWRVAQLGCGVILNYRSCRCTGGWASEREWVTLVKAHLCSFRCMYGVPVAEALLLLRGTG